jgi:hypothetical protein
MLYAKDSARLRAAPSTDADILTKLAADAPLHAIARSTNGDWWRVSLAGGDVGYVHRVAVTEYRATKTDPALEARAPVVTAEAPQPAPARHGQTFLNYVDQTVNWFNETAAHGTPPKLIRPER